MSGHLGFAVKVTITCGFPIRVATVIAPNFFFFAVCWGSMETDWKAFSDGSVWGSVVDSVECGEIVLWKLLITVRKH